MMVATLRNLSILFAVAGQVFLVKCDCLGQETLGNHDEDITFNCTFTRSNIIDCGLNHKHKNPKEFRMAISEELKFLCRKSEAKLVCVADPNNSDGLRIPNFRLQLKSGDRTESYDCKNLDDQLLCLPAARQSLGHNITVAVPSINEQLLLFTCAQQNNDDLNCSPHPENIGRLDSKDFYEIELSSDDGPKFYVCKSTPCGRLECALGESVTVDSKDSVNGLVRIELPASNGETVAYVCKIQGRELFCSADEPEITTTTANTSGSVEKS